MKAILFLLPATLSFIAFTHSAQAAKSETTKPNFVIIFTDDQGYGDINCYGNPKLKTPHLNQMAKEGAKLTSFYVAAPVCTPSRAALMTGCYPPRVDLGVGSNFGVLLAGDKKGLNPNEITIADSLKKQGYTTGIFGKWHLGDQPEFLPTKQGFDEFWGIPYSHDIHPFHPKQKKFKFPPLPLLENETVIDLDPNADDLTKNITNKAVNFIERHKERSFFLYVPHPMPHNPIHLSEAFQKDLNEKQQLALSAEDNTIDYATRDQLYHTVIEEIDWSVGQIINCLKKHSLDCNTIVIFCSDNGHSPNGLGSGGPLKGGKGSIFEGGVRMPTIIWAPGKIAPNSENNQILSTIDLLPTFTKLAGGSLPTDRKIDGLDIWNNLITPEKYASPHEYFYYYKGNTLAAIRHKDWKLHLSNKNDKLVASKLFNLAKNIGETKNVISNNKDIAQKLVQQVQLFDTELKKNVRKAGWVNDPKYLTIGE